MVRAVPAEARELRVLRGQRLRELIRTRAMAEPTAAGSAEEELGLAARGHDTYRQLLGRLTREIRVFAGCNAGLFTLTMLLVWRQRQHAASLLLPAGILALATCGAAALYLLGNDWFWAFLTASHLGYGYLGLVALVAGLLADVAWNEARISSAIARGLWRWHPG